MHTVEILEKARELISDESRWTQGYFAKSATGGNCGPNDPAAACFCSIGALCKIMRVPHWDVTGKPAPEALRSAVPEGYTLVGFNDTHSHAEVLAAFDRAIAAARGA